MKKKALLLVGLYVLYFCTWETKALNTIPINGNVIADPPYGYGYEEIDLQGSLMLNINPNAIVAGVSDVDIYIGFNQSFGNVNISIFNGTGGLVYTTVVNTDVQQVVIIPFTSAASGTYNVELSNANGYAEGDFDRTY